MHYMIILLQTMERTVSVDYYGITAKSSRKLAQVERASLKDNLYARSVSHITYIANM